MREGLTLANKHHYYYRKWREKGSQRSDGGQVGARETKLIEVVLHG